jgi:predicted RNase H-like HicB family nuclease
MDNKIKANLLAERPYILKVTLDQTTDDQPVYFANVLEVEGCFGQGTTQEEAIADLKLAMVDFIESLLDDNMPVPEPSFPACSYFREIRIGQYLYFQS